MQQYKDLVKDVIAHGVESEDRTGTGTRSVFGRQVRFDLSKGFPLVTTKKTFWKGVVIELLWFMRGETNVKFLVDRGIHIWDQWIDKNGDLGPIYGKNWRDWEKSGYATPSYNEFTTHHIDQLTNVIEQIKTNPGSRRLIVSAWNVGEIDEMALPPCHMMFQFYVRNNKLSCQLYQRSADLFLGVPFNIASYALLTHLIANECGLEVGEFIHTFGDLHLYNNHLDQAIELLNREPKELPQLDINLTQGKLMTFVDYDCDTVTWDNIQKFICLNNYKSHPTLKGKVSV